MFSKKSGDVAHGPSMRQVRDAVFLLAHSYASSRTQLWVDFAEARTFTVDGRKGAGSMLGPALAYLFVELDKRKTNLTSFEKAVHQELLFALTAGRAAGSRMAGVFQNERLLVGGAATAGTFGGGQLSGFPQVDGPNEVLRHAPTPETRIDLSGDGWSGSPIMQTNCSETNCPNKAR